MDNKIFEKNRSSESANLTSQQVPQQKPATNNQPLYCRFHGKDATHTTNQCRAIANKMLPNYHLAACGLSESNHPFYSDNTVKISCTCDGMVNFMVAVYGPDSNQNVSRSSPLSRSPPRSQ